MISLVEHFADVVTKVETVVLAQLQAAMPKITGVHYSYGHIQEIVNSMQRLTESPTQMYDKFPRIMLVEDIPMSMDGAIYNSATLHILIVMATQKDYVSEQRQTIIFNPIINPIYDAMMSAITKDKYFNVYNPDTDMPHAYYDRKFWGKAGIYGNVANIFNDYLDAKEIIGLKLKISKQC